MVISKTPLRLSLGGGGTDLPCYYEKFGSMFIAGAINKFIYTTFHKSEFNKKIRLRYSTMEEVNTPQEIKNEILRETIILHNIKDSVEITSHADIPSGTGLGSSGSFGVSISHVLWASRGVEPTEEDLAYEATQIQADTLGLPIGKQDQYVATYGGINCYYVDKEGHVTISPLKVDWKKLETGLVLFFTGYSRDSNKILQIQKDDIKDNHLATIQGLHRIQKLGYESKGALESGNFNRFGQIMNEHWTFKKTRADGMTNPIIDKYYNLALKSGAIGGKLVGAGGGGFLMFYTEDREKLIKSMPLKHIEFEFVKQGSRIIHND